MKLGLNKASRRTSQVYITIGTHVLNLLIWLVHIIFSYNLSKMKENRPPWQKKLGQSWRRKCHLMGLGHKNQILYVI